VAPEVKQGEMTGSNGKITTCTSASTIKATMCDAIVPQPNPAPNCFNDPEGQQSVNSCMGYQWDASINFWVVKGTFSLQSCNCHSVPLTTGSCNSGYTPCAG